MPKAPILLTDEILPRRPRVLVRGFVWCISGPRSFRPATACSSYYSIGGNHAEHADAGFYADVNQLKSRSGRDNWGCDQGTLSGENGHSSGTAPYTSADGDSPESMKTFLTAGSGN